MKRGDPDLTFTLRMKHNRDPYSVGSESDESSTPKKIQKTQTFNRLMDGLSIYSSDGQSSGDEATTKLSPSTPPIDNLRNARRRKGIPHRAPF